MNAPNLLHWLLMTLPLPLTSLIGPLLHHLDQHHTGVATLRHRERMYGIVLMLLGLGVFGFAGWISWPQVARYLQWKGNTGWWVLLTAGLSALAGIVIHLRAKPGSHPWQMRQFGAAFWPVNLLVWIIYLLLYEFYFRGLLMPSGWLDAAWLIALNVLVYALVHVPHGWGETIAAVPYGALLAGSAVATGNIWPAFLGHMALVITTQFIRLNPHTDQVKLFDR